MSALVFLLNKIRRVTWNTSDIHTSKSDYFYIYLFALEAQIHILKEKLTEGLTRNLYEYLELCWKCNF